GWRQARPPRPGCRPQGDTSRVTREHVLPRAFLAFFTFAFIFSLTLFMGTGATAGPRLQGRLAAMAIEIERWLPAHREDIEANARERPRVAVQVADLPLEASVPASAVLEDEGAGLRSALVSAMGETLYREGRSAFNGGGNISITQPSR